MIITISGTPGSGKTTVANILAKKLNFKHYYMGGMRRDIAKGKGMTLNEFNKFGETDPSTDRIVDDYLVKLGKTEDNFVAEGRTAFHFIPNSIKLFIDVDLKIGAERILNDMKEKGRLEARNEQEGKTIDEQADLLKKRVDSDVKRYRKHYNIDFLDKDNYDLWIDSSSIPAVEVAEKILEFIDQQDK